VLGDYSSKDVQLANGIGGVGSPGGEPLRRTVQLRLALGGWQFVTVRHPSAVVSPFAHVSAGAQLLAGCVVQAGACIGTGAVINTASVVEHDVSIGDWTHVAPRALLCGDVRVGAHCHVGAGSVVRQGLHIGDDTVIGAGAVVVKNATSGVLVGVPARQMKESA
jgi:sugar O-acyltransferase (sialic acid O-acetyltransferase NeuD family)